MLFTPNDKTNSEWIRRSPNDVFDTTHVCCFSIHANSSSFISAPCFDRERANGLSSFERPLISPNRSCHGNSIGATLDVYSRLPEEPQASRLCLEMRSGLCRTVLHACTCCILASDCHKCEKCGEAEEPSTSYCTFSARTDKCLAGAEGARLHVWSLTRGSESEWRTSFKNYSCIMGQLTFSFCSNQRLPCTSSPVSPATGLTSSFSFSSALFYVPFFPSEKEGQTWPFTPRWFLQQLKKPDFRCPMWFPSWTSSPSVGPYLFWRLGEGLARGLECRWRRAKKYKGDRKSVV